jgi:UDP-2,3-diacylglucosamine pyrophosphatase LpxH
VPLEKVKLVVSDFHLGKGRFLEDGTVNILEDFFQDEKFIEFLKFYSGESYRRVEVELIINGDFFNLLQIDHREDFPAIIDEDVAVGKMEKIVWGHREVFESLKSFASRPRKSITILVGNHDPGLLFEGVTKYLKKVLAADIQFPGLVYQFDGVHIEHGCQQNLVNAFDTERLFVSRNLAKPVLNLPWGSEFVVRFLNKVKMRRPYIDKIKPFRRYFRWAWLNDTGFAVGASLAVAYYFVTANFTTSRYRDRSLLRTLKLLMVRRAPQEIEDGVRGIFAGDPNVHTVIMGHTHGAKVAPMGTGRTYVNTGTWNDLINLAIDSPGRYTRLTYAEIRYDGGPKPRTYLKLWLGQWHEEITLSF